MRVVPDFEMIDRGEVMWKGKAYPILEIDVVASAYSNPDQL